MRDVFGAYYSPTEEEYERLWNSGLISLDTNVLLSLYRLPRIARDEFLAVLDALRDRLWIPYHVGVEFQRRRVGVILEARDKADAALKKAQEHLDATQEKVRALELDKSGLDIDPDKLLADLSTTSERLMTAIRSMHDSLVDVSASDPIRERLDELFAGKVGSGPADQSELDQLVDGAAERYEKKVPPGFRDVGKEKDPNASSFLFGGLTYESMYGDLIIWRQLLAQAKAVEAVGVLFVTSDKKDDWWWIDHGRTLGPHPELVAEMEAEAGVGLFWMYSAKSFADLAGQYTTTRVSERSLGDIDAVEMSESTRRAMSPNVRRVPDRPRGGGHLVRPRFVESENAVFEWLVRQGYAIARQDRDRFGDFHIDSRRSAPHGVDVMVINRPSGMITRRLDDRLIRAYVEVSEGRLDDATVIVVAAADTESDELAPSADDVERIMMQIDRTVERLIERMPSREVNVLLGVLDDGEFLPVRGWGRPLP